MARKNIKWQVNEAVMDSALPSAARLLMFVFSDLADAKTGQVPEERKDGTTIRELARRTGLDAATVKRHKPTLVTLGWLKFDEPTWKQQSTHETGTYTIAVGRNPDTDPVAHDAPPVGKKKRRPKPEPGAHCAPPAGAQDAPPEGFENDHPGAHSAPPGGAQCATPVAHDAPPIEGTPTPTSTTDILFGSTADAAAPMTGTRRRGSKKPKADEPRPDVEALCDRLAELMVANECKPPDITKAWRDEARRMIDIDRRDFAKAMRLLEWSQRHHFWKSNIHSMPKFRKQYDTLRLQANDEWEQHRSRGRGGPDWNAAMARAEARDDAAETDSEISDDFDDEPLWKRALPA